MARRGSQWQRLEVRRQDEVVVETDGGSKGRHSDSLVCSVYHGQLRGMHEGGVEAVRPITQRQIVACVGESN